MHQNGEINIKIKSSVNNQKETVPSFNVYLTDLYANTDMDYSFGPRYMESRKIGIVDETLDLKVGEYNLIFDCLEGSEIVVTYSVYLIYHDYPNSKYVDWALALVDIGASMLLVGLTLYLGLKA